jgi:hypothetical protein
MIHILIPVDDNNCEEAKITKLADVVFWAFIKLDEGKVVNCDFFKDKDEITDYISCLIVKDKGEYVWPFMEQNISVLIATSQRYIEDIIEAFLFKELLME